MRCEWCERPLVGRRSDARYCDARCRLGASKARRGISVQKAYKPTRGASWGGLQVSYRKGVRVLAEEFYLIGGGTPAECTEAAEDILAAALSPAQRARLERS